MVKEKGKVGSKIESIEKREESREPRLDRIAPSKFVVRRTAPK